VIPRPRLGFSAENFAAVEIAEMYVCQSQSKERRFSWSDSARGCPSPTVISGPSHNWFNVKRQALIVRIFAIAMG
jgi:hypothetical protein